MMDMDDILFSCRFSTLLIPISLVFFRLPFAFHQAGFVFGTLLLLVSAWATSSSIALLVKACDEYRLPTYEKIVEQVLGRRARNVVEWSILIFCLGTGEWVKVVATETVYDFETLSLTVMVLFS
jgi:Transmembrane amino acid transporter protein